VADISRSELSTIIEEEYSHDLLAAATDASVALQAFRTVQMGTKVTNLPVLATLPEADFVAESATESDGVKPTAQVTWANKVLTAEEIAVIIPIHENVVDDASTDVLDEITAQGGAAIGRKLDGAVLFGDDKPVSWTSDDLLAAAVAASATFQVGAAGTDDDLMGSIFQAAGAVDEAGWDPSVVLAPRGLRYRLANLRAGSADGTPVFLPSLSTAPGALDSIAGLNGRWVSGNTWDRDAAEALVVDADRVVVGVRQDITVKFLDQATVGGINLAERDMVALRFKARYAYVLGNTLTTESATGTPVAAVLPEGAS
jgi:HK97 family phage major capsid protein